MMKKNVADPGVMVVGWYDRESLEVEIGARIQLQ